MKKAVKLVLIKIFAGRAWRIRPDGSTGEVYTEKTKVDRATTAILALIEKRCEEIEGVIYNLIEIEYGSKETSKQLSTAIKEHLLGSEL